MPTLGAATLVALLVTLYLAFGPPRRSLTWAAIVTPLASIIGSGFLICGPVLAREFGGAAALAMALLLAFAYAIGAVVRFNIAHAEDLLRTLPLNTTIGWCARLAQLTLAIAYSISVAYYLKLLAEFSLHAFPLSPATHALVSRAAVTGIIVVFASLAISGGGARLQHFAHATVSLKIGVIAGMLTALAAFWLFRWNTAIVVPSARFSLASVPLLLGLLVTVQGFETSRYMTETYEPALRIRSMKYAQWISSGIYLGFLLLLTPFLTQASQVEGVAGILEIMKVIAPFLGVLVLVGAAASQLSAAVADTIGSAGLSVEVSRGRVGTGLGAVIASGLAITVVWLTDPFQVVAVASRAFGLFYMMQCALAYLVATRLRIGGPLPRMAFAILGAACFATVVAGAPAE